MRFIAPSGISSTPCSPAKRSRTFRSAELPAELQALQPAEREAYVRDKTERREDLQRQVGELAAERSGYLEEQRRQSQGEHAGLDAAILEGIREVAATKGFAFP